VTGSISVLIPSLRGGDTLLGLVSQLAADAREAPEVLVADNGLPEETRAALEPGPALVLPMGGNLGFGAAVNRAAAAATGDVLVVLNDDVEPLPGFLERLAAPARAGAEMVAGVLVRKERPELIESAGINLDATLSPHDHLQNEPVARLDDEPAAPFGPCGGAAAYLRSAFAAAGGFDEGFFAYFEDVDLALRIRAAGGRCALAADARALHSGSGTLGYHSLEKALLVGWSRGYLMRKYGVLRRPLAGPAALTVEAAASVALAGRHRSLRPALARVRGWRACTAREPRPAPSAVTVRLGDGLRSRYARSTRTAAPEPGAIGGLRRSSTR
jgi:GT2 family glycosyltransferase